jgi:hypothetical protein
VLVVAVRESSATVNSGVGKVVALVVVLPYVVVFTALCWALAVGLWRAWVVGHLGAIVVAGLIGDLGASALYSDAHLHTTFDLGRLVTETALILLGPGPILVLLLLPASLRVLAAGLEGAPAKRARRTKLTA